MFAAHGLSDDAPLILGKTQLSTPRLKAVFRACDWTKTVAGDTAEIGCQGGGVSRIMAKVLGRFHWSCDTFCGLVDAGIYDGALQNGTFATKRGVADCDHLRAIGIEVLSGKFPDCASAEMARSKFALVHIDVDTYESIKACFTFFAADRMNSGGMMMIDDVIGRGTVGAKRAWSEIASGKNGWQVIEENDPQIVLRFD